MNPKVTLPALKIKGKTLPAPIIQGGMGVGVSLAPLAGAVAKEGGLGIVSSACLDLILERRNCKKYSAYDAAYEEVSLAKQGGGIAGINVMVAIQNNYSASIQGALDAKADVIISGAGFPFSLPGIQEPKDTALVPIVSSARALEVICLKWEKLHYRPDAVVLEGPLAGGHLGFPKVNEIWLESNKLENLLPLVKETAIKHGDFPVIVAGGIYTYEDIIRFIALGADGVQMGTRFLATEESTANTAYKQAVVECQQEDIIVVDPKVQKPGSACGLPFRIIKQSPMYSQPVVHGKYREPLCNKEYVALKGVCPAQRDNKHVFCICNGLLSSAGIIPLENEPSLWTVGTNAFRINKILSTHNLMERLKGNVPDD